LVGAAGGAGEPFEHVLAEPEVLGEAVLGGGPVKKYNRQLRDLIAGGKAEPSFIVSHELPLDQAPEAYEHFDNRDEGWTKVVLHPAMAGA